MVIFDATFAGSYFTQNALFMFVNDVAIFFCMCEESDHIFKWNSNAFFTFS